MTPVTVLYVDHVTMLSGGERSLLDLVRVLDRTRFSPALVCPGEGPLAAAFRDAGCAVSFLPDAGGLFSVSRKRLDTGIHRAIQWVPRTLSAARHLAAIARACGARLLASNSQKAHVIASLASLETGLPLVWHMRDCLDPSPVASLLGLLAGVTARRVIAISDAVTRSLADAGGFPLGRVVRVHNGIDLARGAGRPVLRAELGLPPDAFLAGAVGQLSRWKGAHVLLDAARAMPSLHVALAGSCLFAGNEAAYFDELQAAAREPGLRGRVHLLGQRDDVPDVMASLDALVHPAIQPEPFGRVLVEAMAAGCAVVASDVGAVREVVGDAGALVPPGDAPALAMRLAALAADPARRAALGAAGRARALALFGIDRCRRATEAVYERVLAP